MKQRRENKNRGHDEQFFPVRNEADFEALHDWLSERSFTDIGSDNGFVDKHGKPMMSLRLREGGNGKPSYKKAGLIWFADADLRDKARPIIEGFAQAA